MVKYTIILLGFFTSSLCMAEDVTSILQKVESRNQGDDFVSQFKMTIQSGGEQKVREFNWWANRENSGDYSLIKYSAPRNLKGSGLLVQSDSSGQSTQWIYLSQAAKKEPRRVASQDKGKSFMGSDYYYIDFERFRTRDFNAKLLKKDKWQGYNVATIKLTPKSPDYPYAEMTTKIDLNSFVPVYTELVSPSGTKRIYQAEKLEKIQGIWTITRSSLSNSKESSKSTLEALSVKYNQGVKKDFFNQSNLKVSL